MLMKLEENRLRFLNSLSRSKLEGSLQNNASREGKGYRGKRGTSHHDGPASLSEQPGLWYNLVGSEKALCLWTDPLGRRIALSKGCWNGHILRNHPGMAFRMEEVGRAIQEPEEIRTEGNSRIYFRTSLADGRDWYMKVVARLEPNAYKADGFVATAFPVRGKKEQGEVEWQKN